MKIFSVITILSFFLSTLYADPIFRINSGAEQTIDKFGTCKKITNNSGKDIMVAANSSAEWLSFVNNANIAGVTKDTCVDDTPDTFDIVGDVTGNNDPAYTNTWTVAGITGALQLFIVGCHSPSASKPLLYKLNTGSWTALPTPLTVGTWTPSCTSVQGSSTTITVNNGDTLQFRYTCSGCSIKGILKKNDDSGAVLDTFQLVTGS